MSNTYIEDPVPAAMEDQLLSQDAEPAEEINKIPALEPSTLPSHPLRVDDVPCFLPKVIG